MPLKIFIVPIRYKTTIYCLSLFWHSSFFLYSLASLQRRWFWEKKNTSLKFLWYINLVWGKGWEWNRTHINMHSRRGCRSSEKASHVAFILTIKMPLVKFEKCTRHSAFWSTFIALIRPCSHQLSELNQKHGPHLTDNEIVTPWSRSNLFKVLWIVHCNDMIKNYGI